MLKELKNNNSNEKIIDFPKQNKNTSNGKKIFKYFIYIFLIFVLIRIFMSSGGNANFHATNTVRTDKITLASANNYAFEAYKEGYVMAKDGKISCFNTNQELQWEINGSKTAPTIKVNDKYVLVYYNEDKLAVVTDGNKTQEIKTPGNVMFGNVNKNGYTILFLEEAGLKNKLAVYNPKGEMLYYRDNPDSFITYALLSDNNYTLITNELVTDKKNVSSKLVVTNTRKNKTDCTIDFHNSVPGGLIMTGKKEIITLFETKMQCYNLSSGRMKWQSNFDGKSLYKYTYDDGLFAFIFNDDDSANTGSRVVFYRTNGKRAGEYITSSKIHGIDMCNQSALLTLDRQIQVINIKGKHISSADITYDIKDVIFIATKKCALILNSSREAKLLPLK